MLRQCKGFDKVFASFWNVPANRLRSQFARNWAEFEAAFPPD